MKLLALVIAAAMAQGDEKKVPPRHPLQRLNRLVQFSHELLDDWFTFLPSKDSWKGKFERNAGRMKKNFERGNQRCGYYDGQPPHGGPSPGSQIGRRRRDDYDYDYDGDDVFRYDRSDPSKGTKQITTGYRKWAIRFMSECSGQKNYSYQINRMNKWNDKLQAHLAKQQN